MARRKNTKRIDPRYFLSETTYRDNPDRLNESTDILSDLQIQAALAYKGVQDLERKGMPVRTVEQLFGVLDPEYAMEVLNADPEYASRKGA